MNFPGPTERQARIIWLAVTGLAIAVLIGLVAGLVWGLGRVLHILSPVLWPLAVAGVLAYLLDPLVDWIQKKGVPRKRAILAVFALALVMVAALFSSVVPQLVIETRDLVNRIPGYAHKIQVKADQFVTHPPAWAQKVFGIGAKDIPSSGTDTNAPAVTDTDVATSAAPGSTNAAVGSGHPSAGSASAPSIDKETLQTATAFVAKYLPKAGSWLFGQVGRVASWFGVLAGLALIPVYAYYLLVEKRGIESKWADYLPLSNSKFKDELVFVIGAINNYLIAFFRGQVLVAICDGILYTLGFLAINLPYAVLVGVMATFLTLIPYIGAIVTCAVALVLAFVQFGDWLHPALVLVVFAVVQGLEGFVISPKIMGDRVGLHPLTIIIAVMAGTTLLGGLLGGILAIPLTAVLRVVMSRYVWKRKIEPES